MRDTLYSKEELMRDGKDLRRYIDDGVGFWLGSTQAFKDWINTVNEALKPYGLYIDEFDIQDPGNFINFLDIMFCIDKYGSLQTDLYVKPTDSRSYLHFSSCHPNHVFSAIVYSQCLRLRRIINNEDRLLSRIKDLRDSFMNCGYPFGMVTNISDKVMKMKREETLAPKIPEVDPAKPIRISSTYGTDDSLVCSLKKYEGELLQTKSFSKCTKPLFSFVKKTATSVGNKLAICKKIALQHQLDGSSRCNRSNCKCCNLIHDKKVTELTVNCKNIRLPKADCKSKNVVYLARCKLCHKSYVGRTCQKLHKRANGHRQAFYKIASNGLRFKENDDEDLFALAIHLYDHGIVDNNSFDKSFNFHVIKYCSPSDIQRQEHLLIHELNTLYPKGINKSNPLNLQRLILDIK